MSRGYEIHDDDYEPSDLHITRLEALEFVDSVLEMLSPHTIIFEEATRVVVVDNEGGRMYDKTVFEGVEIHVQDGGKTLKIFPMT